jgi:hypothetical protein
MPDHVHLIATPAHENGPRATFAKAHRRYTGAINARFGWTCHLFQGRFGAVVMDEPHLLAATRYVALKSGGLGVGAPCRRLAVVERSRTPGVRRLPTRTAATPGPLTRGSAGPAISSRTALARW